MFKLSVFVLAARCRSNLKFIGIHWLGSFVSFVYVKLFVQLFGSVGFYPVGWLNSTGG